MLARRESVMLKILCAGFDAGCRVDRGGRTRASAGWNAKESTFTAVRLL